METTEKHGSTEEAGSGKIPLQRLVTWHTPMGEVPDGLLLVEVDLASGESDIAIVYIDDKDCQTLREHEYDDVWTNWQWSDVSRYALMSDVLLSW